MLPPRVRRARCTGINERNQLRHSLIWSLWSLNTPWSHAEYQAPWPNGTSKLHQEVHRLPKAKSHPKRAKMSELGLKSPSRGQGTVSGALVEASECCKHLTTALTTALRGPISCPARKSDWLSRPYGTCELIKALVVANVEANRWLRLEASALQALVPQRNRKKHMSPPFKCGGYTFFT